MRIRTFAVALVACLAAPAANASANTIKTGVAESDGGDSTLVQASLTNSCDATVSYRYGPSADQLTQTVDSANGPHHSPSDTDFTRIFGLTEGTTYYYQAVLTSSCGNAEGAVRCFVHSSTINTEENPACPDDPGDASGNPGSGDPGSGNPGSGDGSGNDGSGNDGSGDNGSGNHQSSGPHHIHPKGHNCLVPNKIGYVYQLRAQHLKCKEIFRVLDTHKARTHIGRTAKVNLGKYHCKALNRLSTPDYHCWHGNKGWYMNVVAGGEWTIKGPPVFVDY
jgi:hypothetical protein